MFFIIIIIIIIIIISVSLWCFTDEVEELTIASGPSVASSLFVRRWLRGIRTKGEVSRLYKSFKPHGGLFYWP